MCRTPSALHQHVARRILRRASDASALESQAHEAIDAVALQCLDLSRNRVSRAGGGPFAKYSRGVGSNDQHRSGNSMPQRARAARGSFPGGRDGLPSKAPIVSTQPRCRGRKLCRPRTNSIAASCSRSINRKDGIIGERSAGAQPVCTSPRALCGHCRRLQSKLAGAHAEEPEHEEIHGHAAA